MKQMMSLGGFAFSFGANTAFDGLSRTSDGGWTTVPRFGQKPLSQRTGPQLENISISGTWFKAEGMANLNKLRALQAQGMPLLLADGYGVNLGHWTIKKLQEKQSNIIDDGTVMVLAFTIELEEYANDHVAQS